MTPNERILVLELLKEGKISTEAAEKLLSALSREDRGRHDMTPRKRLEEAFKRVEREFRAIDLGDFEKKMSGFFEEMKRRFPDMPGRQKDGGAAETSEDSGAAETSEDGGAAETSEDGGAAETSEDGGAAETSEDGGAAETSEDGGAAETSEDSGGRGLYQVSKNSSVNIAQKGGAIRLFDADGDHIRVDSADASVETAKNGARIEIESVGGTLAVGIPSGLRRVYIDASGAHD